MNKTKIKSAFSKIKTDDQFRKKIIYKMIQEQSQQVQQSAGRPERKRLLLALVSICLVLAGVTLIWQFSSGFQFLETQPNSSIQPETTNPIDSTTTVIESSETNPTTGTIQRLIVHSDEYADELASYKLPDPGAVIVSHEVSLALEDPKNADHYFFVHIYVIPAEQYEHCYDQYIYHDRTIAEWRVLVDLSNGTYPYSEYNGDHGGKITLEEWQKIQEEAKTLSAQENLEAATAKYNSTVRPMIEAARVACQKSEFSRLTELGYEVSLSQTWGYVNVSEKQYYAILTGLLSAKQIEDFSANSKFGYLIEWVRNGDGVVNWQD